MPRMTSGLSVARSTIALAALSSLITSCFQMPRSDDARGAEGLRKSTAKSESDSGDIIVKVNDREISRGEFFKLVLQQAGTTTLQRQIIDAELVRQEAERLGIEIPAENVDAAVDRYIEGLAERAGGVEKFKAQFESQGLPFAEVRRDMVPQVRAELLRLAVIRQTREVNDKELRDYYGQTYKKKRFVVRHMAFGSPLRPSDDPTRVGARKIEALDRANRAVEKVKEGHDFAEIAKVESDDEMTAGNGGLLPAIAEDGPMPAEFK
ncbi:MAG: peptidylprolyl isomerase, partial [Planctomycetota bacterium]